MILNSLLEPYDIREEIVQISDIILGSEEEEVFDEDTTNGYEQLNTLSDTDTNSEETDSESEGILPVNSLEHFESDHDTSGSKDLEHQVAQLYCNQEHDILVNCDKVKSAMAGFTLPSSAIPPWAKNIPESEWNNFLIDRMKSKVTC